MYRISVNSIVLINLYDTLQNVKVGAIVEKLKKAFFLCEKSSSKEFRLIRIPN